MHLILLKLIIGTLPVRIIMIFFAISLDSFSEFPLSHWYSLTRSSTFLYLYAFIILFSVILPLRRWGYDCAPNKTSYCIYSHVVQSPLGIVADFVRE